MDITPLIPKGRQVITGYGAGGFKINDEKITGSIVICADETIAWSADPASFTLEDFAPVLFAAADTEILLIGTGGTARPIPGDIRAALKDKNIAVESMDTGAACRTYNVLLAEGRRAAAALIAV